MFEHDSFEAPLRYDVKVAQYIAGEISFLILFGNSQCALINICVGIYTLIKNDFVVYPSSLGSRIHCRAICRMITRTN